MSSSWYVNYCPRELDPLVALLDPIVFFVKAKLDLKTSSSLTTVKLELKAGLSLKLIMDPAGALGMETLLI